MTEKQEQAVSKLLGAYELAQKIAFPILLGVASWLFTSTQDHDRRLIRIEVSRYTAERAEKDKHEIINQIRVNSLSREQVEALIDSRAPWLRDKASVMLSLKDSRESLRAQTEILQSLRITLGSMQRNVEAEDARIERLEKKLDDLSRLLRDKR